MDKKLHFNSLSTSNVIIRLLLVIAVVEILIMLFFSAIELDISPIYEAALDGILLASFSFIPLYFGVILPFIKEKDLANKLNEDTLKTLTQMKMAMDSHSIIAITDVTGKILEINDKFCDISGYSRQELIGKNHRILNSGNQPKSYWKQMFNTLIKEGVWHDEVRNKAKDGSFYWVDTTIVAARNDKGKPISYVAIRTDITEQKNWHNKLSYQASHDDLTGLINRREFEQRLNELIHRSESREQHPILFIDLDQFKIINDTCGHHAGDELLKKIPLLITEFTRKSDFIARLGGDEFGVILTACDPIQSKKVAKSIQKNISNLQFYWEDKAFKIGASIGVAEVNDQTISTHQIMKSADSACYAAKEAGRNQVIVYDEKKKDMLLRSAQMDWISSINTALNENLFILYAQPIIPIKNTTKLKSSYEILIRMKFNDAIIPPFSFLPAAERYNKMIEIDRWVVKNVVKSMKDNSSFLDSIDHISINLSGQSITDKSFMEFLIGELSDHSLMDKICLEITETSAIQNFSQAKNYLSVLSGMGIRFSLDDFGSGLSSFAYLKELDVDYLKIDGYFIKNIAEDKIDYAMVKSIHEVGTVMGKKTIAEFVENEAIIDTLKTIGIDYAQGYGIGKPVPLMSLL